MGSVDRYWVSIATKVVVKKNGNLAGTAIDAKGWALKGYEPVMRREDGSADTGVIRFRRQPDGTVTAEWESHPFTLKVARPQWATTVCNIINE